MKVTDLQTEDWEELVEKINDECCILLIGPNLYKDSDNNVLQEKLHSRLRNKFEDELFEVFDEDGLFTPIDNSIVNDMRRIVKNFYNKGNFPDAQLKKIAEIPFHCIITLTPDMLLNKTFNKYDLKTQIERFSMTKPLREDLQEASKENPLIYNMFGSIDEDETIILTHNDFFNYLKNIIGDERMPSEVRKAIGKATDLIFLGFPFEKWWSQLLMRLLGLHTFPGRNRWATEVKNESNFTKMAKKQFKIKFLEDDADDFINTLYEHISKSKVPLRKLNFSKKEAEEAEKEVKNKRIEELKQQILKAMDLINDYEKKAMLSDDPKEIERSKEAIKKLNEEVKAKSGELRGMKK